METHSSLSKAGWLMGLRLRGPMKPLDLCLWKHPLKEQMQNSTIEKCTKYFQILKWGVGWNNHGATEKLVSWSPLHTDQPSLLRLIMNITAALL
jgi:hypothetical protein